MLDHIPFFASLDPDVRNIMERILALLLALLVIWVLRGVLRRLLVIPLHRMASRTGTRVDDIVLEAATAPMRFVIIGVSLLVSAAILEVDSLFITHLVRTLFILAVLLLMSQLIDLMVPSGNRLFSITGITIE
ncbi:MAG TPA: hypothetical protein VHL11_21045, partial [Phototrophicaceae bacterium]|nr:hypothetical protein [Phototrophicaceae bacterium]